MNHGLAVSQDWWQSFAQMADQSDKTWSCHQLGNHCEGQLQARLADSVDILIDLAPVYGKQAVVGVAAAWPSVESWWSLYLVESVGPAVLDALLAQTAGRDETRMWKAPVTSFGRQG